MQKKAATGRFTDCIVRENKRFLLLIVQQQPAKSATEFFAYVLTGKISANQRKKIQGCDFLLFGEHMQKFSSFGRKKKTDQNSTWNGYAATSSRIELRCCCAGN